MGVGGLGGGDYFSIGRAIHLPYEVVEIWTSLASQGIWNKNEVSWQATCTQKPVFIISLADF